MLEVITSNYQSYRELYPSHITVSRVVFMVYFNQDQYIHVYLISTTLIRNTIYYLNSESRYSYWYYPYNSYDDMEKCCFK